jgi:hypothetical protein
MVSPSYVTRGMSGQKRILIASSNIMFTDVIAQSQSNFYSLDLIQAIPSKAAGEIKVFPPDGIIMDGVIGSEEPRQFLFAAQGLPHAQMELMNLRGDDFVALESHTAVFGWKCSEETALLKVPSEFSG